MTGPVNARASARRRVATARRGAHVYNYNIYYAVNVYTYLCVVFGRRAPSGERYRTRPRTSDDDGIIMSYQKTYNNNDKKNENNIVRAIIAVVTDDDDDNDCFDEQTRKKYDGTGRRGGAG